MFGKHLDIYLCINCTSYANNLFKCYKFDNYHNADDYYKKNFINQQYSASSLIPVCSYVPNYFRKYILQHKISKLFANVEICSKINIK